LAVRSDKKQAGRGSASTAAVSGAIVYVALKAATTVPILGEINQDPDFMQNHVTSEEALIFVMVMASAVDNAMAEKELRRIGQLIDILPVFAAFDKDRLIEVSQRCAEILNGAEGLDIALEIIRDALPERLYETAYALAVEIAAVDLAIRTEEIRLLELLRSRLKLDKLVCASLERSAAVRYRAI
jgi:tellurite resistance protein